MIKPLFTLLIFCGLALQAREATDKPNIIFVLLDDLGKEWINCYGGEDIKTPRIDQPRESTNNLAEQISLSFETSTFVKPDQIISFQQIEPQSSDQETPARQNLKAINSER